MSRITDLQGNFIGLDVSFGLPYIHIIVMALHSLNQLKGKEFRSREINSKSALYIQSEEAPVSLPRAFFGYFSKLTGSFELFHDPKQFVRETLRGVIVFVQQNFHTFTPLRMPSFTICTAAICATPNNHNNNNETSSTFQQKHQQMSAIFQILECNLLSIHRHRKSAHFQSSESLQSNRIQLNLSDQLNKK